MPSLSGSQAERAAFSHSLRSLSSIRQPAQSSRRSGTPTTCCLARRRRDISLLLLTLRHFCNWPLDSPVNCARPSQRRRCQFAVRLVSRGNLRLGSSYPSWAGICQTKGEGVVPRVLDSCGISVIGNIEDLGRDEGIYGSYRRKKSRRAGRTTVSVLARVASGNV